MSPIELSWTAKNGLKLLEASWIADMVKKKLAFRNRNRMSCLLLYLWLQTPKNIVLWIVVEVTGLVVRSLLPRVLSPAWICLALFLKVFLKVWKQKYQNKQKFDLLPTCSTSSGQPDLPLMLFLHPGNHLLPTVLLEQNLSQREKKLLWNKNCISESESFSSNKTMQWTGDIKGHSKLSTFVQLRNLFRHH